MEAYCTQNICGCIDCRTFELSVERFSNTWNVVWLMHLIYTCRYQKQFITGKDLKDSVNPRTSTRWSSFNLDIKLAPIHMLYQWKTIFSPNCSSPNGDWGCMWIRISFVNWIQSLTTTVWIFVCFFVGDVNICSIMIWHNFRRHAFLLKSCSFSLFFKAK